MTELFVTFNSIMNPSLQGQPDGCVKLNEEGMPPVCHKPSASMAPVPASEIVAGTRVKP